MRTFLKVIGYGLLVLLVFGMASNPEGTADTVVDIGVTLGDLATNAGKFFDRAAERAREITS